MESFVLQKWIKPLVKEDTFHDQFAFVPLKGRGCTSALTTIYGKIIQGVDNNNYVNVMLVDFSKAFDRAIVSKMLDPLVQQGTSYECLHWLYNFITDRMLRVNINGSYSEFIRISTGTPQGGVISPILFAFLISTLRPRSNNCFYYKYADDLTVVHVTKKGEFEDLQAELNHIKTWCTENRMLLNEKKTKIIHVQHRKTQRKPIIESENSTIEVVPEAKLLGVHIHESLKWKVHVTKTIKSATRYIFHILTLKRAGCSSNILETIYHTHIRSRLSYAFPAMCNMPDNLLTLLNKVEKRVYKIIGQKPSTDLKSFCTKNCETMKENISEYNQHPYRDLLMSLNTPRLTRSNRNMTVHSGRTSLYTNSLIKFFI